HGAAADLVADLHVGDVADVQRHPVPGRHHDPFDLFLVGGAAEAVDQEHAGVFANGAAADVAVVLLNGLHDLIEGQLVFDEPVRVDAHQELLLVTAPAVDLGGPFYRSQ